MRSLHVAFLCVLTSGCASLKAASAGQIGCPEEEITITDDEMGWSSRTWTASCRGRRYQCSAIATGNNNAQVNCAEEVPTSGGQVVAVNEPQPPPNTPPAPPPPDRRQTNVRRTTTPAGVQIRAWLDAGNGFTMHLEHQSRLPPGRAFLLLEHAGANGTRSACTVRLMIDGELVDPGAATYEVHGATEVLRVETAFATIERLARAQRVVGRVCEEDFAIDDVGRSIATEFVTRVNEESAFTAPSPQPAP